MTPATMDVHARWQPAPWVTTALDYSQVSRRPATCSTPRDAEALAAIIPAFAGVVFAADLLNGVLTPVRDDESRAALMSAIESMSSIEEDVVWHDGILPLDRF